MQARLTSPQKNRFLTWILLFTIVVNVVVLCTPSNTYLGTILSELLHGTLHLQHQRIASALSIVFSYVLFYYWIQARHTHAQRHHNKHDTLIATETITANDILIVYASQTGYAEQLAAQTQNSLQEGGMSVRSISIAALTTPILQQAHKILFIVSTTGEGDAPDSAVQFTRQVMQQAIQLTQLEYAILALGDRHYQAYCAFGHQLDQWLRQHDAHSLFDLVEVDNGDDGALRHWQHHLGQLSGHTSLADWHQAEYENWTLSERHLLNPHSLGGAVYHVRLSPSSSQVQWQAGDIAEILPRRQGVSGELPHREYSIASIPRDGTVDLIVRQMLRADGSLGFGSGWLTHYAQLGESIALRVRSNRSFHLPTQDCPMILIGNGTGIAGLRALLKQRAAQAQGRNWLFFGERQRSHDFFCQNEIEQWQANGHLTQVDLAFSRDQEQVVYVQDKLREQAEQVRQWVTQGAAIYVCGSLAGMAKGVDLALREILGDAELERLRELGLYRRDVY